MKTVRVYIADDHRVTIAGLQAAFAELSEEYSGEKTIQVVGSGISAADILDNMQRPDVDVFVTDIGYAGTKGDVSIVEMMLERNPSAKIVVYSMRSNINTIKACYAAGAKAHVKKESLLENLFEAIFIAADGDDYFEPGVIEQLARLNIRDPLHALNSRERTIFIELAKNPDIELLAKRLDISEKTILNIITTRIKPALGVSRKDFRRLALSLGVIDDGI